MYLSYSHTGVEQRSQKKTRYHYYKTSYSKRAITAGSFRTVGDASSPPGSKLVAVVAVEIGGYVPQSSPLTGQRVMSLR